MIDSGAAAAGRGAAAIGDGGSPMPFISAVAAAEVGAYCARALAVGESGEDEAGKLATGAGPGVAA